MTLRDVLLAAIVASIWGFSFVATKVGLQSFTPAQLVVLRFVLASLPALVLPRPALSWPKLIIIGLALFTGQFLLLFLAFDFGLPPGVASVTQQSQAFFTLALAALFLGERPGLRQWCGMGLAAAGLMLLGASIDADLTALGLTLALAAALSWSVGNILLKRAGNGRMVELVIWLSLVPPLPALLFSRLFDNSADLTGAILAASWQSLAAVLYLGFIGTVVAYSIWGHLLSRHPASEVVPFALLVPCTGIVSSYLVFGEVFGPLRAAGLILIVVGFALVVVQRRRPPQRAELPGG